MQSVILEWLLEERKDVSGHTNDTQMGTERNDRGDGSAAPPASQLGRAHRGPTGSQHSAGARVWRVWKLHAAPLQLLRKPKIIPK